MHPRIDVMTDPEMRSMSFGLVHNPVFPCPEAWQEQKNSLFDQRTFGPAADDCCACGKYRGFEARGIICDVCGVKIGEAAVMRKGRFGHINLGRQIAHPWFEAAMISVIPVLPIGYRGDKNRTDLDILYSHVVREAEVPEPAQASSTGMAADPLGWAVRQLFENESTAEPVLYRGRPARSLCHFAFEKAGTEPEEMGIYLVALMLKVVV